MTDHQHRWAPTGLIVDEGKALMSPCLDPACDAELWQRMVHSVVSGPGMSINGMRLDIEDDPDGSVAKVVCRETAMAYKEPLPLKRGDVVLDIGAHVGIVSIYLAKRYPGIRVYAFEPVAENFQRMERNIGANHAIGIVPTFRAVTSDGRNVFLRGNVKANSGGTTMIRSPDIALEVVHSSISIADVFTQAAGRVALLKIDCEGAEYEILEAAGDLLHRVDRIRGEFHTSPTLEAQGKTIDGLIAFCRQYVADVQVTSCRL